MNTAPAPTKPSRRWLHHAASRLLAVLAPALATPLAAGPVPDPAPAVEAINRFGIDLHQHLAAAPGSGNLLLSPYSIQSALAMTFAGAEGQTRAEMSRVLHFDRDEEKLQASFKAMAASLREAAAGSRGEFEFNVANRLFGMQGYRFNQPFLQTVATAYGAPLEPIDFSRADRAAAHINSWVADQTQKRIQNLIHPSLLSAETKLVLVNALHLRGAWWEEFPSHNTKPRPFHLSATRTIQHPTLRQVHNFGHQQFDGFKAISLGYRHSGLQFLILLPDPTNSLARTTAALTPTLFQACRNLPVAELDLHLPKLHMEPAAIRLGDALQALGLRSAFDKPTGSANFSRMAPTNPDRLSISEVVHKTFLHLDEKGTEAAAATAVMMAPASAIGARPAPIPVHVDRPFLFAIQKVDTGACLFLGQVVDPR